MKIAKQKRQRALEEKRAARQNKAQLQEQETHKYLITLAYDGSRYGGYARQKHKNTVQNILEAVLADYLQLEVKTTEASRTDSGVHALNQKTMFTIPVKIPIDKAKSQLNERLPKDIIIKGLQEVEKDFHCRYQVKNKTYEYTIHKTLDPRAVDYAWHVGKGIDVKKMVEASRCLVGTHDFTTFKSAKATTDTSVRTINFIEIREDQEKITIQANADGFLYNMVRLIVKALVDVGTGKQDTAFVKELLERKSKPDNLESAPAQGLCLMEINY